MQLSLKTRNSKFNRRMPVNKRSKTKRRRQRKCTTARICNGLAKDKKKVKSRQAQRHSQRNKHTKIGGHRSRRRNQRYRYGGTPDVKQMVIDMELAPMVKNLQQLQSGDGIKGVDFELQIIDFLYKLSPDLSKTNIIKSSLKTNPSIENKSLFVREFKNGAINWCGLTKMDPSQNNRTKLQMGFALLKLLCRLRMFCKNTTQITLIGQPQCNFEIDGQQIQFKKRCNLATGVAMEDMKEHNYALIIDNGGGGPKYYLSKKDDQNRVYLYDLKINRDDHVGTDQNYWIKLQEARKKCSEILGGNKFIVSAVFSSGFMKNVKRKEITGVCIIDGDGVSNKIINFGDEDNARDQILGKLEDVLQIDNVRVVTNQQEGRFEHDSMKAFIDDIDNVALVTMGSTTSQCVMAGDDSGVVFEGIGGHKLEMCDTLKMCNETEKNALGQVNKLALATTCYHIGHKFFPDAETNPMGLDEVICTIAKNVLS